MTGIYIHIPWCLKKCYYCDFNSHGVTPDALSKQEMVYVESLRKDWLFEKNTYLNSKEMPKIDSIFFGGGTPSLFSGAAIKTILEHLSTDYEIDLSRCEVTLESNPSTIEYDKFCSYRESGINRISIGAQSFDEPSLKILGRTHDKNQIIQSFETARRVKFNSINIDLMYSLPNQDKSSVLYDISSVIKLGCDHVSWYQLMIEPNTAFYKNPPLLPKSDQMYESYLLGQKELIENGYHQYEIAAFTKKHMCKHNLNYWNYGDYFGFGAGAHSKLTINNKIYRMSKVKSPKAYNERAGSNNLVDFYEEIHDDTKALDSLMNLMRLRDGFPIDILRNKVFLSQERITSLLQKLEIEGWAKIQNDWLVPTTKTNTYLNQLLLSV